MNVINMVVKYILNVYGCINKYKDTYFYINITFRGYQDLIIMVLSKLSIQ